MKSLLILILLFSSAASFAQESKWATLFNSVFYSENIYEGGRCTQNILRFLRLAKKNGMDVSKIEVIEMVNKGLSTFGMVHAEASRGSSELDHTANWFHHVFLKNGNTILDFDFTMKPSPTEISTYFQKMYTTEKTRNDKARCIEDIGRYQVTLYSGSEYLRYYDEKISSDLIKKQTLYLKDLNWACR